MVLLSIFFTESDLRRIIMDVLYSFYRIHALALHLAVNITLSFLYEIWALALHTSVSCISLQNANRTALCYATILLSENILIFDINHQQNTESDQIETIKTIIQTTRPRITWKVLWLRLPFLKKYSIKCRKDLDCEFFYSELKRHNVSHYIYYLATDNIHIVLKQ